MNLFISDSVYEAIAKAAEQAQAHFEHEQGVHYAVKDLQTALVTWLELSIEQLAEEALYHCVEGDRTYAFNRSGFTSALEKLTPAHTPQDADELAA